MSMGKDTWEDIDNEEVKDSWEDDDEVVEILPTVKKTNISSEADEVFAEKKRLEGLVMKSDLNAACDLFGIQKPKEEPKVLLVGKAKEATSNKVYDENCLDKLQLHTKQDFDYFSSHLTTNLTRFDESKFYLPFLEMTISKLVQTLSPMDIKKLGTVLNNAAAAKQKQIAEAQSKGKKKALNVGGRKSGNRAVPDDFDDAEFSDDYD